MVAIDNRGFIANHLLSVKGPCRVATTAAITLSGEQTIDGVAVEAEDRVLVKDQSSALQNGIYVCKTGEWELADDFDQRGHVVQGTRVFVISGTANALTEWYVTTTGRPWPGREAIAFSQLSASEISGLTPTDGYAIIGNGTTWTAAGFTQAGSGAVARTWLNKNRWRVDAEDYGAVGDGSTNDTAAIQAAIDYVNGVGGGEVRFESNEYRLGSAPSIKTGVRLIGKGSANTILKLNTNANTAVLKTLSFDSLVGGGTTGGPTDWGIVGIRLDGNRANQSGSAADLYGLAAYGTGFVLDDVFIYDCKGHGYFAEWGAIGDATSTSATRISSLTVDTCGRHGFYHRGPQDIYAAHVTVIDASQETDNTYDGFLFEGSVGNGRWYKIHAWHRSSATNRVFRAARVESSGNDFINPHFEGGRRQLLNTGSRNTYKAAYIYGPFSTNPMATIRGSHLFFEARIEDTTAAGASCLEIGETGTGLFFSHLDVVAITAATNAVVVTEDSGRNTGTIKTVTATNAYTGSWDSDSSVLIQKPDGTFEDRGVHAHGGARTFDSLLTASVAGNAGRFVNTTDAATVQALRIEGDRATPTAFDQVYASWYLSDSAGNQDEMARLSLQATTVSSGTESARLLFRLMKNGTLTTIIFLDPGALFPDTNDVVALGTGSLSFSDLFLASGGVINWNDGDVTLTHASNLLTLAGGNLNLASGQVLQVNGTQVVSAQGAAVSDASGGATVDAEARTAINTLLARLRTHGLIAS